jgi:hypothetical protein
MVTPPAGEGPLRASHADREQVVDVLKAAFVQGRLAQDELDSRVGQALAARTYAELSALTADLPAAPAPVPAPASAPQGAAPLARRSRNTAAYRAVKVGAGAIAATIVAVTVVAVAVGQPEAAPVLAVAITFFAAIATAFVAALIALALKVESLRQNRSRGGLPPGPASGPHGQASPRPPVAGPDRRLLPDPRLRPDRRLRRRPPGSLAVGRAG